MKSKNNYLLEAKSKHQTKKIRILSLISAHLLRSFSLLMQCQCAMSEHSDTDLSIKTGEKHHKTLKYFEEGKKKNKKMIKTPR